MKARRNKRFLYKELAELYKVHRNTIKRDLKSYDIRYCLDAIRAIRFLDSKYRGEDGKV